MIVVLQNRGGSKPCRRVKDVGRFLAEIMVLGTLAKQETCMNQQEMRDPVAAAPRIGRSALLGDPTLFEGAVDGAVLGAAGKTNRTFATLRAMSTGVVTEEVASVAVPRNEWVQA